MRFDQKLKKNRPEEIWQEYCGFLDISMDEYMAIQTRLLQEQIELYANCGLGRHIMQGKKPATVDEFRRQIPLTTYTDYADILLEKREDMLPAPPAVWLETTWESGSHPVKLAPYTEDMLSVYRNNILAAMILSTAREKGRFHVTPGARALYGLAPLPYATGLFPRLIDAEMKINFMPSLAEAAKLSFSQQSKRGFKQSLKYGMDLFFGMSSVVYAITKSFDAALHSGGSDSKSAPGLSPVMLARYLRASYKAKRDGRQICPADLFELDGFVCVGTDTALFKDELEKAWGCRPLEICGGTEPTCMGTETWSKDGMVFFPDACFYEFIPEQEMRRSLDEPDYVPETYLMNELAANQCYELVITVLKGGAFMRYRVGDVFRCLRLQNERDGLRLPQFEYVDRIPTVIDIAGFTRITQPAIEKVMVLSRLPVSDWCAVKEYDGDKHSFLHLFVELDTRDELQLVADARVLREHMSIYFRCYDHDYQDLKRLLGVEPLQITILRSGLMAEYRQVYGRSIRKMNPQKQDIVNLLRLQDGTNPRGGAVL